MTFINNDFTKPKSQEMAKLFDVGDIQEWFLLNDVLFVWWGTFIFIERDREIEMEKGIVQTNDKNEQVKICTYNKEDTIYVVDGDIIMLDNLKKVFDIKEIFNIKKDEYHNIINILIEVIIMINIVHNTGILTSQWKKTKIISTLLCEKKMIQ